MDVRARNAFSNKLVTSSIIKCASGLDYYGLRNEIINKTNNKCSRYDCVEMCDYAVCSEKTKDFRKQLVADLLKDLIAARTDEVIHNDLFDIIEDILISLKEDNKEEIEELETN